MSTTTTGATMTQAMTWIPVSERLPETDTDVLWQPEKEPDEHWEPPILGWLNQWRERVYVSPNMSHRFYKPLSDFSHWMPLPEPPDVEASR
jgi:hypothetical protein